jgi:hypothetical protein
MSAGGNAVDEEVGESAARIFLGVGLVASAGFAAFEPTVNDLLCTPPSLSLSDGRAAAVVVAATGGSKTGTGTGGRTLGGFAVGAGSACLFAAS